MSSEWRYWHLLGLFLVANLALDITPIHASGPDYANSIPNPSCNTGSEMGIVCQGDASSRAEGGICLNKDSEQDNQQNSAGYVFFIEPIKMLDLTSHQVASFNTTFTFTITISDNRGNAGDGVSFIMFANQMYEGESGGYLGVYNSSGGQGTPTFSIEFDTFQNAPKPFNDSSDNHVGVDVGEITSNITRNASDVGIQLNGGQAITAWIDYDAPSKSLEIRIANSTNPRPTDPFLTYNLDLYGVVEEEMFVGIGASTGAAVEYHHLINWTFNSFGLPHDPPSFSKNLIIGISAGIGSAAVLLVGCMCRILSRRSRERALDRDFESQLPLEDMPFRFSYNQLSVATNGFNKNSQLGKGGSSSVYKGKIASTGTPVAVKKVNVAKNRTEAEKLFAAEISVISRLRHRNLVKLLGWCRDRGHYLLVYELMPNASLDKVLYKNCNGDDSPVLSWTRRSAIVRGVAAALAYLHEGYAQQVIHRDIKSSNVMLDEKFNPKVGDFGLARLIDHSKNLETKHVAGTLGYIAPEAVYEGVTNDKTDVYAFGMLVLEIACGRPPLADGVPGEEAVLVEWVWKCYGEGNILRAADCRLMTATEGGKSGDCNVRPEDDEIAKIQLIGLVCCHPNPDERPSMRDVELFLAGRVPLPLVPRTRPLLRFYYDTEEDMTAELMQVGTDDGWGWRSGDEHGGWLECEMGSPDRSNRGRDRRDGDDGSNR